MRQLLLFLLFIGFFTGGSSQVYFHEEFSDSTCYGDYPDHITTLDGGNALYFTLTTTSYVSSLCVVKLATDGQTEWTTRIRGSGNYQSGSLVQAGDSSYFFTANEQLGPYNNVYALAHLDKNGNVLWLKNYVSDTLYTHPDIRCTPVHDGLVVGGRLMDTIRMIEYLFMFKVDTAGTLQWSRCIADGLGGKSKFRDIITCRNGDLVVCGDMVNAFSNMQNQVIVRTDPAGNLRWTMEYKFGTHCFPGRIIETKDGGFTVAASYFDMSTTLNHALLFHTDSAGNFAWARRYYPSVALTMVGRDVHQCRDGSYLFLSSLHKTAALLKTDTAGNRIWMKQYQNSRAISLDTNAAGMSFFGTSWPSGNPDFFQADPYGEITCMDSLPLQVNEATPAATTVLRGENNPVALHEVTANYTLLSPALHATVHCTNLDPKGISEYDDASLVQLFPVPATSMLHVQCETTVQRVSLINAMGQTVKVASPAAIDFDLDVSTLPPGIYFLQLETGGQLLTKKIIINE